MRYIWLAVISCLFFAAFPLNALGAETLDQKQADEQRLLLYKKTAAVTNVPWHVLAAADQYERNVRRSRRDLSKQEGLIGIYIPAPLWAGPLNPLQEDTNPARIDFFGGIGKDGNGDGVASKTDDEDLLYTFAHVLGKYGSDMDNIKIGLWNFYHRDKTVGIIVGHHKIFKKYGHIHLTEHAFPVPLRSNYSYRSTWGDARGWGGRRIHEGTDIFANYGVPVRSTAYGVVEMKGWNRFGGWRVGIRDLNNTYHYYAHLNGFADGLHPGQIVEPGQLIGSVGSSGYGPPGTSGKFPPHLHYGMYKDNGRTEWSFDPHPHLRLWERAERQKNRKKK